MENKDWKPELYLKFNKERTQPSMDLVSRIDIERPNKIIDIGCGPGNSTQVLVQRWSDSNILGIDNSAAMIKKAETDYPNQNWKIVDIGTEEMKDTYDVVFSNAVIQWVPNHSELLTKFHRMLNNDGVLAVQIPMFWDMPLGKSIAEISKKGPWSISTKGVIELFTIHDHSFYFEELSKLYRNVELWETDYMHIMDSHSAILEMIRTTGLKPFLDRLENEGEKKKFEDEVLDEIRMNYPAQKNGKVIFPFKRLFFTAKK